MSGSEVVRWSSIGDCLRGAWRAGRVTEHPWLYTFEHACLTTGAGDYGEMDQASPDRVSFVAAVAFLWFPRLFTTDVMSPIHPERRPPPEKITGIGGIRFHFDKPFLIG